jgi:NADPH:quinone reductase-like Zn-dependent oxidoreductase
MLALLFDQYGDAEVLSVGQAPEPHPGPGQVRVSVRAASVNPFDCKLRSGRMQGIVPVEFPAIPGVDASGVVDEVGEGVSPRLLGEAVLGLGDATTAEHAVLNHTVAKPHTMSFEHAAAMGVAVEAAGRCLDLLDLAPGSTLLVDGAAGGVGSALTRLAVARRLTVVGTAGERNHADLRAIGVTPTTYGPGLVDRVAALAPRVDGAVDLAGKGSVPELVTVTGDPRRVVTLADFSAYDLGVHVADDSGERAVHALDEAVRLWEEGRFEMPVAATVPMADGARAHRLVESGHVVGKVVVTVP